MAKAGDELEHPVTGERLVWRRVARDTNGELVEGDLFARPGGHPAAAHVHPHQEERFGVLAGTIKLQVDGEETTLRVGEWAEVPVGRPHTWWNDSQEDAHVLVQVAPALRMEMFFETFFGLAKHGRDPARVPRRGAAGSPAGLRPRRGLRAARGPGATPRLPRLVPQVHRRAHAEIPDAAIDVKSSTIGTLLSAGCVG